VHASRLTTDVATVAALIGDPSRAAMLEALMVGGSLPAGELARRAAVRPATASVHLARLVAGRLVVVEARGRHRYYRLAGWEVAAAVEALGNIAPTVPVRSLRQSTRARALQEARSCYDHLAGRLGVALYDGLVARGAFRDMNEGEHALSSVGVKLLGGAGVDFDEVRRRRRSLARACLDWTQQRPHLAGAVGAALLESFTSHGWVQRRADRVVYVNDQGYEALGAWLGYPLDPTMPRRPLGESSPESSGVIKPSRT
jgi:DNA-binding transcriptional ArsR family regulator